MFFFYGFLSEERKQAPENFTFLVANYASVSGTEKLRPKGTSARKVYIEARATSSQNENRPVKEKRCIKKNIYFLHTHVALSLKCNKCFSKVSWVDCQDKQFTRPTDMADRCVTSYVKNGDEQTFSKYCGSKEYCEYSSKATCKAAENLGASECKVTCCSGELCNSGFAAAKISGVVMLTCVLTLLVFSNL